VIAQAPKATTTLGSERFSYADLTIGANAFVTVPAITKIFAEVEEEFVRFKFAQACPTKSTELASTPQQAKPASITVTGFEELTVRL